MKTIELTLYKNNGLRTYVAQNIKSFERVDDNWGNSFTILYLCDGSQENVHQTLDEINHLINN